MKRIGWLIFSLITLLPFAKVYGQQDVDFHLGAHLLTGKKILKVNRDFRDPYLWVLAANNEVYRVNSSTLAVDNYTATFSAYNNLQFIDIAGYNQDTVFIATNSTNLLEYKKGSISIIGASRGLTDTINSIGMANGNGIFQPQTLHVATTHGLARYMVVDDDLQYFKFKYTTYSPAHVFAATYRSEMLTDDDYKYYEPTYYPVLFTTYDGGYAYDIRHAAQSGGKINTAFDVPLGVVSPTVYQGSFFWGNENGFYQECLGFNGEDPIDFYHLLNNINVNKITDIFGLTSFYAADNPIISKDNLLIGTDNGLYFTNSLMDKFRGQGIAAFSLFHYNELGNIRVNDICVNRGAYLLGGLTACEDGVWLATDDGYLLKPDYAKYFESGKKVDAVFVDGQLTDPKNPVNLCGGDTLKPEINPNFTNNTIQWVKDGNDIPGENKPQLNITAAGEYYAILYAPCENVHVETNHLKVNVTAGPVFSFDYPDKLQYCSSTPVNLKITGQSNYQYRWYTNGTLNGNTTSLFTVTQTGKYKVEVGGCTNSWVPSKEVEVDLVTLPVPQISQDKPVYCAQDVAALSVNTPTDPSYTINWYRDGTLLPADKELATINETTAGNYTVVLSSTIASCTQTSAVSQLVFSPAPVFTFDYPDKLQYCFGLTVNLKAVGSAGYQYRWYKNGTLSGDIGPALAVTQPGKYKIEVSACAGSWVASKEVQVDFIQIPAPQIKTDKPAYCISDNATLSIAVPPDPSYTISWFRESALIAANTNQSTLTTNIGGNYTVAIANNLANTDGTICSESSLVSVLTFDPPPAVSIEQVVNTSLCDGQTIGLVAHYNGGTVKWSTGETTGQISVTTSGSYKATVTTPAGCQVEASTDVLFFPNPVISVKDTSLCPYKHQTIILTAQAGFSHYAWNGQPGGQTYQVSSPQTVSLTVTDANGCQASQQIKIADQCPEVFIPNTFTPNGDGINDTWVIDGLDQSALVKVFTRYGSQVFDSKGYGTAWNGEYQEKRLPTGVYYYIVTAKNGTQKFSGSLTIIY